MYQYPFLAGCVFSVWVFPQTIGLLGAPYLPLGALDKALLMSGLCAWGCYLGHIACREPMKWFRWHFDHRRLQASAGMLSVGGGFFFVKVSQLADDAIYNYGGAWTGVITIYGFFSWMVTIGLVLGLVCFYARPNWLGGAIILFDLSLYMERIMFWGRRQLTVELVLIFLLSLYFFRGKVVPRVAMGIFILVAAFGLHSAGDYRGAVMGKKQGVVSSIVEIDFRKNLEELISKGGEEFTNLVYIIEAVDRRMEFDFGLSHWNGFVRAYVPAQLLGGDFKDSLIVDSEDAAYLVFGYISNAGGSTRTGMADSFASAWYFGAANFVIISYVMAKLFRSAMAGDTVTQIILMLTSATTLQAITHSTDQFFMVWPKVAVFLIPVLYYARVREGRYRVTRKGLMNGRGSLV